MWSRAEAIAEIRAVNTSLGELVGGSLRHDPLFRRQPPAVLAAAVNRLLGIATSVGIQTLNVHKVEATSSLGRVMSASYLRDVVATLADISLPPDESLVACEVVPDVAAFVARSTHFRDLHTAICDRFFFAGLFPWGELAQEVYAAWVDVLQAGGLIHAALAAEEDSSKALAAATEENKAAAAAAGGSGGGAAGLTRASAVLNPSTLLHKQLLLLIRSALQLGAWCQINASCPFAVCVPTHAGVEYSGPIPAGRKPPATATGSHGIPRGALSSHLAFAAGANPHMGMVRRRVMMTPPAATAAAAAAAPATVVAVPEAPRPTAAPADAAGGAAGASSAALPAAMAIAFDPLVHELLPLGGGSGSAGPSSSSSTSRRGSADGLPSTRAPVAAGAAAGTPAPTVVYPVGLILQPREVVSSCVSRSNGAWLDSVPAAGSLRHDTGEAAGTAPAAATAAAAAKLLVLAPSVDVE